MPKVDGLSVLKQLKEKPPSRYNGPIFVLTQLNQDQILRTSLDLGAKGYLIKSDLDPGQVLTKISQILEQYIRPSNQ